MPSSLDWGKLVSKGRAKAVGISWSDEESKAVAHIAQTLNKTMGEIAPYIRKGILTIEEYKTALYEANAINPFLKLSKPDLVKKAESLGLVVSPDASREVLAQIVLEEEDKIAKAKKIEEIKEAKVKEAKVKEAKVKEAKPKETKTKKDAKDKKEKEEKK